MFSPFKAKNTQYGIGNGLTVNDAFFWFIAGIHKSTTIRRLYYLSCGTSTRFFSGGTTEFTDTQQLGRYDYTTNNYS
jgi:hypothetical protein